MVRLVLCWINFEVSISGVLFWRTPNGSHIVVAGAGWITGESENQLSYEKYH